MTRGWAIEQDGEICVESISPGRIGAIVNWLITRCDLAVLRGVSDDQIERAFAKYAIGAKAEAIEVDISRVLHS